MIKRAFVLEVTNLNFQLKKNKTQQYEKYQIITNGPNPLIVSVRKEDDKRFLEYFILASEVKEIQKIINKSKIN